MVWLSVIVRIQVYTWFDVEGQKKKIVLKKIVSASQFLIKNFFTRVSFLSDFI